MLSYCCFEMIYDDDEKVIPLFRIKYDGTFAHCDNLIPLFLPVLFLLEKSSLFRTTRCRKNIEARRNGIILRRENDQAQKRSH